MIDLKDKDNRVPNLISILCLVLLVVMFAYLLFVPKPTYNASQSQLKRKEMAIRLDTKKAEDRIKAAEATISSRSWPPGAERVSTLALGKVNGYVIKSGVRLLAFRPQRALPGKDLQSIPYLVSIEGTYPKVLAFCRLLDREEQKLAVNLIQISSADSASDKVTASVGLLAYARIEPPAATTTPLSTPPVKKTTTGVSTNG